MTFDTKDRIRARAIRRAGELAKQLMQPVGRPADNVEGNHNIMSRAEVKERSGLSDHQLSQATRIAVALRLIEGQAAMMEAQLTDGMLPSLPLTLAATHLRAALLMEGAA